MHIINFHPIFMENAFILGGRLDIGITQMSAAKLVSGKSCFGMSDQKIILTDNRQKMWIQEDETYLVFGAASGAAALLDLQKKFNLKYIIFQTENLRSQCFSDKLMMGVSYKDLMKKNLSLDWSNFNISLLKEKYDTDVVGTFMFEFPRRESELSPEEVEMHRRISAENNTGLDFLLGPIDDNAKRDIDLFFCGARNDRREASLNKIQQDNSDLKSVWEMGYTLCAPQSLNEHLLRTKFVLNIPFYDDAPLATHRINKALALGCQVISPPSSDKELDEMYADYVHFGDINELIKNLRDLPNKKSYTEFHNEFGVDIIENSLKIIREHG